jgi:hypothetical protein
MKWIWVPLLVLIAGRMVGGPPPRSVSPAPVPAPSASPFAYILEDGTEKYLPMPASSGDTEVIHAASALTDPAFDSRAAVYTWSSPLSGLPTSASTTWQ